MTSLLLNNQALITGFQLSCLWNIIMVPGYNTNCTGNNIFNLCFALKGSQGLGRGGGERGGRGEDFVISYLLPV